MFRASSCPSSGVTTAAVAASGLPSERGDSSAVGRGPITWPDHDQQHCYQNRVLRRIFGPGRVEVTGEWRKLHDEELNDLYCSPNIIRMIKSRRLIGAGLCRVLVWKSEGKRPIGRPRRR
jgi:hypothetical protein